jgi:3-hydroxyisobutyrate dehydrogenase-like beta-hydroxyacid dehydrogenase
VQEAEGAFLDAPFTGSRLAAEKGALVYYVGGDIKVLDRVRAVLETTAKEILHVGGIGDATVLKVATNMISATTVQVLSEAYALTVAAGIDPEKLAEALQHNAGGSVLTAMKIPAIIAGEYEPHFSLKNMFKDAQIALGIANRQRIDLPALSTTASVMFKGMQKGWSDEDYSVVARHYQEGGATGEKR